ncbi:glycosyltransferase family 8 protein [Gracilibacillus lacisalsi]|uniref:glycosyltransferase family 8 protein n=1 Tax=Gracilibacillus lacisalsi TaxID=393087 RepID=UPI00037F8D0A|nr:glycosyltransferase family 8 protein [Gracilibacillus lacisalsi]
MGDIEVITVTDDKYAQHLGVMIESLFRNKTSPHFVNIYVIDGGIKRHNKEKLKLTIRKYKGSIHFLQIDDTIYKKYGLRENMSKTAYYKIEVSEILHFIEEKVLFLDSDIVFNDSIHKLWDTKVDDYVLAATPVPNFNRHEELGLSESSPYFNSGVMVINLTKWREFKIFKLTKEFLDINSNHITLHDQDALNAVINDKWLPLPQKWNQRSALFDRNINESLYDKDELFEAKTKPSIIHFNGSQKPWHYLCDHPFASNYKYYLRLSEWRDFVPPEKNIFSRRNLIVFGASNSSVKVTKMLKKLNLNIIYYVDNDEQKVGKTFDGIIVHKPEKIKKETRGTYSVIVASVFYDEIKQQLEQFGLVEYDDFISGLGKR